MAKLVLSRTRQQTLENAYNNLQQIEHNFKNNKTSVYCDAVDLIVYYNDKRPLGGADAIV